MIMLLLTLSVLKEMHLYIKTLAWDRILMVMTDLLPLSEPTGGKVIWRGDIE